MRFRGGIHKMAKKEYKIEQFRIANNRFGFARLLERILNNFSDEGWTVKNVHFHSDILTYEIVLERDKKG